MRIIVGENRELSSVTATSKYKTAQQYKLVKYSDTWQDSWEKMVSASLYGTFLHSRRFLSYHGSKFDDQSLLIYDDRNVLRAIFPAASDPADQTTVVSHPGITYGGLHHDGWLYGQRCLDAFRQILEFYATAGLGKLIYKAVPSIYHRMPAQDDIYALFRLGADRYRVDLSTTIDLQRRGAAAARRQRMLKKSGRSELRISTDFNNIEAYWKILTDNLKSKYDKQPVHSLHEICLLKELFPEEIELVAALIADEMCAGALLFHCPILIHAQYLASSPAGRERGALDLVIEHAIRRAETSGKRFFDFGISSDEEGTCLNDNLHTFKCEFGACGSIYEHYKIELVLPD